MQPSLSNAWARPASEEAALRLANQERRRLDQHQSDAHLPNGVRPELLSIMIPEVSLPTREPFASRTFITDHLVGLALALSIAVSIVTALTTLTITGELPGRGIGTVAGEATTAPALPTEPQLPYVDRNIIRVAAAASRQVQHRHFEATGKERSLESTSSLAVAGR